MRSFYQSEISTFKQSSTNEVIGQISQNSGFDDEVTQKRAWIEEIVLLQKALKEIHNGTIHFEFSVPRMGSRIDVVLVLESIVFVLEFKVGAREYLSSYENQAFDYALDLKNFHEPSHDMSVIPVVVATKAENGKIDLRQTPHKDKTYFPISINGDQIQELIIKALNEISEGLENENWSHGVYKPTPTIIEAAKSLYNNHSVNDISRRDASAKNLSDTSQRIEEIISFSKQHKQKSICFVTGVPGAGKTLVGLNIATNHSRSDDNVSSVFLSGNGPLVEILQEALTRDRVQKEKERGNNVKKGAIKSEVKAFIQNVHHYRDEYITDKTAPYDHVAIFDEAQRAWNHEQTKRFMKTRKGLPDFDQSEPEFLISCLDRHQDWAVIVCLVGGGQEINTGEAGISEWIKSLKKSYPDWGVYVSERLTDSEYASGEALKMLKDYKQVEFTNSLHLSVSLRSFRAEKLSEFVKCLLDLDIERAREHYVQFSDKYPIFITRGITTAKEWLKAKARGSERYGVIVSSQAERLKPFAIDVKSPINPVHWFLNDKTDVRSSYFMESVATEFHIQGLELDWTCVSWDGDLRLVNDNWQTWSFKGNKWQNIKKRERQQYLINAYRVLLTRARQGMIIFIPEGNDKDQTRSPQYYDGTFQYLKNCGLPEI